MLWLCPDTRKHGRFNLSKSIQVHHTEDQGLTSTAVLEVLTDALGDISWNLKIHLGNFLSIAVCVESCNSSLRLRSQKRSSCSSGDAECLAFRGNFHKFVLQLLQHYDALCLAGRSFDGLFEEFQVPCLQSMRWQIASLMAKVMFERQLQEHWVAALVNSACAIRPYQTIKKKCEVWQYAAVFSISFLMTVVSAPQARLAASIHQVQCGALSVR